MNRKLIDFLYRHQIAAEERVKTLKAVNDFDATEGTRYHDLELENAESELTFLKKALDILFEEAA